MRSTAVDGFALTYDRIGDGPPVVLLHGWPGDRTDYRRVVPLLADSADVVVPDLRGFGESDKHLTEVTACGAPGQAAAVAALITELGLTRPVVAGYDVGSRVAQALAREHPELVGALVITPPVPGPGRRVLGEGPQREFWYQQFHQLPLPESLIDGRPDAVRAYLDYIWRHWSGPDFRLSSEDLDHLVAVYGGPGAFVASISFYRNGSGTVASSLAESVPEPDQRIATPTTVLWPEHDPLFPLEWSDRLDEFFADARLRQVDGVGHFVPLEAPDSFASAVRAAT